jgi:thiamine-phosphate pyrophosphorylase
MTHNPFDLSVYVITDRGIAGNRSLTDIVRAAIQGGATIVQLREKDAPDQEMIDIGQQLHPITREAGIPLIVNDRLKVALAIDAEGLHVGQEDVLAEDARRQIGPERILGVSAETVEQAIRAEQAGADYLGVGDVFGTLSKPDVHPPIGLDGLAAIVQAVSIPVVAIGGITLENAGSTVRAGASGVSVISAIMAAPDPQAAARELRRIVDMENQNK